MSLPKCSFFLAVSETTIINGFHKTVFKESMFVEEDGPFSVMKSSIDQLQQHDENLVSNDFLYKDMLRVDHNIAVMREVMTDEELAWDIIEVADDELQEEDKEALTRRLQNQWVKKFVRLLILL